MDYKKLLEDQDFDSPEEVIEWMDKATTAITDLLPRAEAAEKTADEYAESARSIALWLSAFCDRTLSYPSMISNAARKVSLAYADMETRAEAAEKRAENAERERDAAIFDLERAEEAAEETCRLLDNEVHPVCDYSVYLAVHDSVSNIINWEQDNVWRGQKEE